MTTDPPDIRELIRAALAKHPIRVVAKALRLAPATVVGLTLPAEQRRCQPGSLALARENLHHLAALTDAHP
jgi:hypothetical protein